MATFNLSWDFPEWTVGRDGSARLKAFVHFDPTTEDEEDIENAAIAGFPVNYAGYLFSAVTLKPRAWGVFEAVAKYTPLPAPDTGVGGGGGGADPEFAFEVSSETIKAMANLATVSQGAVSGRTAPDHGGLIGVSDDKIEGVDVPQMVYSFSEVHHFNNAAITTAYKIQLAKLVGRVNIAAFRGFAAGEVLCSGVSGSARGADLWSLRYAWAVQPNEAGITIGPLTGISKRGWDYLELHYEDEEDVTNKKLLKKPYAYTVHQVLRYADYSLFGIGV